MQIVIVGNGIAGISAASVIRGCNKKVSITLISKELTPAYSACVLANYISGETDRNRVFIRSVDDYSKENIVTEFGVEVEGIDIKSMRIYTRRKKLPCDKLILATGGLPLIPWIEGHPSRGIFTIKTMEDADRIIAHRPKKVIVVGSGPIGIEIAAALRKRGCEIYLVELEERILPSLFDERSSSLIQTILEENGIKVLTSERVLSFLGRDNVYGIITNKQKIYCDTVIMAAGMYPNAELAKQVGCIEIGKGGAIRVDAGMKTSVENVFACGDCV